ncbi:hypothetical protein AMIS_63850 [Actinoplanes missouriensis 431]|uniref:Uncharacterized protein n=1 Tax=Actinoplanes missouriensis (strain ATCC 14538 / DSM 43046 / CBS 188.64 / JCM 3121 / NBRC 102363 / NCIMB 12654 / NRRL B-3342 / UNCC 431) TaxID=512565 RepID=I0HF18_ACTM4|nr:hypothetical protein [Actinoplanes missouriensis]BAL91605.1 hypothetical protein AMIS_63850 [Actinoplanes missouriensis 431]
MSEIHTGAVSKERLGARPRYRAELNWLLAVLPGFPLLLLVLRLWYLSRQDMATMLLLVQYINPLGMLGALFITLSWTIPAAILVIRVLGGILLVSVPGQAGTSYLAVAALRMPGWVVGIAAMIAAFTWQMQLLPLLAMLVVAILGLTAVQSVQGERPLMVWITLGVPVLTGVLVWVFVWPGVAEAVAAGEWATAALLALPPLFGPVLTGPVPAKWARMATYWPAIGAAFALPFVVGVVFLRAPVLPDSAVEVAPEGKPVTVVRGQLIAVDDTSTTMLQADGAVTFIPNGQVLSKTLCPDTAPPSYSGVTVRGWPVEASGLRWIAPTRTVTEVDPRCLGRPLDPS